MVFVSKHVQNQLSTELLVLEKELIASGLVGKIDSSTLLVYSALKSGVTDIKEIADNFFLSEPTVEKQYRRLMHVRCRILKIRRTNKTRIDNPEINITIQMLPDLLQQQVVEIETNEYVKMPPISTIPVTIKHVQPLSKKDKLKRLQL